MSLRLRIYLHWEQSVYETQSEREYVWGERKSALIWQTEAKERMTMTSGLLCVYVCVGVKTKCVAQCVILFFSVLQYHSTVSSPLRQKPLSQKLFMNGIK